MLIGQYGGKIGAKNRVAFPKKFREELGDSLIITQGFENSLIVVSEDGWKALLEGTEGKPFTNIGARETQRFLLGTATNVKLDEKGRFVMPDYLKKYANLENNLVFLGISRYVEIWDEKTWREYNANLVKNIATVADRLDKEKHE